MQAVNEAEIMLEEMKVVGGAEGVGAGAAWGASSASPCASLPAPAPARAAEGAHDERQPPRARARRKNAATNPPSRSEILDDSSIYEQNLNHTYHKP